MRRVDEDAVLRLAVERGLLAKADLVRLALLAAERKTDRLDLLGSEFSVSPEVLAELVAAVRESPPASVPRPPPGTTAGMGPRERPDTLQFAEWKRYRVEEFLGAGGMGRVYKAFDPRLQRHVALKFMESSDPEARDRFRREARAQAQVEHQNLCKIHEVGEFEGRPFISMQFIDGVPLRDLTRKLPLDQKLAIIADVAEALHEAHGAGLIHRDIKPGNIMVEETATGWRPILMDFGLARQVAEPGMTVTGAVLGTPMFMPPEQARGEAHRLDRRADVYSLGATLYTLLAERAPFLGDDVVGILEQVVSDLPPGLRDLHPEIPADVESITMKCLRKDPAERYSSARELAEDLRRHLDGFPVSARPTSVVYRWKLKIARYRFAATTGVIAAGLLAIALGWGLYERWTSSRAAAVAASFGQQVERMDSVSRMASMAALHDVRPERARIRAAMEEIAIRMEEVGTLAEGPGHYALGRGRLALAEWDGALAHLQSAWDAGFREPQAAYALGLVHIELYRRGLEDLARTRRGEQRDAAREELERRYRDPALEFLRSSEGVEIEAPGYVQALLAHHEGRHADALHLARDAYETRPWFYEARELEGDVHFALGLASASRGDYDGADGEYELAERAYAEALAVGASDLGVLERMAFLAHTRIVLENEGRGKDVEPWFDDGMRVVELGLTADPDSPSMRVLAARLHYDRGQFEASRGEDPTVSYEAALASAGAALSGEPGDAAVYSVLGSTHRRIAEYRRDRGEDPRPSFEAAIRAYDHADRLAPDYRNRVDVGSLQRAIALDRIERGEDPVPNFERSVEAYRDALALDPDRALAHQSLGAILYTWARHRLDGGEDPRDRLAESIASFERALETNSDHLPTLYNVGRAYRALGNYRAGVGEDPGADLRRALDVHRHAVQTHPESVYLPHLYDAMGKAHLAIALDEFSRGSMPWDSFDAAEVEFRESIRRNSNFVPAHTNLAALFVARGGSELTLGLDPTPSIEEALASADEALAINPRFTSALLNRGDAHVLRAQSRFRNGGDPSSSASAAEDAYDEVLITNPASSLAHIGSAQASTIRGRWQAASSRDPDEQFKAAEAALRASLDLVPANLPSHHDLAEIYRRRVEWLRARGQPARTEVLAGIEQADAVLARNPRHAEALALRGVLFVYRADEVESPPERTEALRLGRGDLQSALGANRHLRREFGSLLESVEARLAP